jgi:hypothetical protein
MLVALGQADKQYLSRCRLEQPPFLRFSLVPSTVFEPATYTQKMFNIGPYGQIFNLSVSIPSFGANAYSGTVVEINDQLSIPPVTDQTRIVGLNIDASREPNGGVSVGCGLCLIAASGHGIPFVDVRHARITGLKYGIELSATDSGWMNGNHFSDVALSLMNTRCTSLTRPHDRSGSSLGISFPA